MDDQLLRIEVIETCRRMNALGINQGKSGNASVRIEDGFLLTPSGVTYQDLVPDDVVAMGLDGNWQARREGRKPSSEWPFHLAIMRARPDIGAIVHTHGRASTTLACMRMDIPAFHYMVALAGGDSIRCAPYATFGTQELSEHALAALEGRTACLLANHGLIACGRNLGEALALAVEVETLADMYWRCLAVGQPHILDETQMSEVRARFAKGYGVARRD